MKTVKIMITGDFNCDLLKTADYNNNKTLYGALTRWGYTTTHITVQCT